MIQALPAGHVAAASEATACQITGHPWKPIGTGGVKLASLHHGSLGGVFTTLAKGR